MYLCIMYVFNSDHLDNFTLIYQQSPGKLEFMALPREIPFFQGRPRISNPSPRACMNVPDQRSGLNQGR